jgi:putative DNA primase/helicase
MNDDMLGEMIENEFHASNDPNPNGSGHDDTSKYVVSAPGKPYENAERFVADNYSHSRRDLLIHHGGAFEAYDGRAWPLVEDRALRAQIYDFFADKSYWHVTKKDAELRPFDPTIRKVADVIDALKAYVHVSQHLAAPAWLDGEAGEVAARELVSLENGLLHIPSRTLFEHTPNLYTSWSLPYAYDENAPAPTRWLLFLDELWGDDDETKDTLQEWFGYLLSGDTRQQKMLMFVGPKRSGKGTICRVIGGLLGHYNVAGPTLASLSTNFGLSPLIGKPVAIVADARLRSDDSVIVERLLSISGEDLLTIDKKYSEHWSGKLPTRFVLVSNETPRLRDSSGALASRFIIVPFVHSWFGHEDTGLTDELLSELPGILRWALDGLARLQARGHFVQPRAADELLQELEDLGSPVSAFVRERCTVGPTCTVEAPVLYAEWTKWCDEQGVEHPTNAATFGRDLRAARPGVKRTRPRSGERRLHVYRGIKLRDKDGEHDHEADDAPF